MDNNTIDLMYRLQEESFVIGNRLFDSFKKNLNQIDSPLFDKNKCRFDICCDRNNCEENVIVYKNDKRTKEGKRKFARVNITFSPFRDVETIPAFQITIWDDENNRQLGHLFGDVDFDENVFEIWTIWWNTVVPSSNDMQTLRKCVLREAIGYLHYRVLYYDNWNKCGDHTLIIHSKYPLSYLKEDIEKVDKHISCEIVTEDLDQIVFTITYTSPAYDGVKEERNDSMHLSNNKENYAWSIAMPGPFIAPSNQQEMNQKNVLDEMEGIDKESSSSVKGKDDDNYIKMDGEYHEFEGGAIRYTKTGKGRFDLIPWETVKLITDKIANDDLYEAYTTEMDVLISLSQKDAVEVIIDITAVKYGDGIFSADALAWMLRDLAIHYEKGAEKYGVDNWKKGIPESSFWDSGCRHTCQFINGMEDEPHWISAIWNMLGYLWTINKKS